MPYLQGKAESLGLSKQRSRDILKHRDTCERRWPVIKRLDLLWHMTSFFACLPQSIVILEIHRECISCTFADSSIHFQSTIFVGVSGSRTPIHKTPIVKSIGMADKTNQNQHINHHIVHPSTSDNMGLSALMAGFHKLCRLWYKVFFERHAFVTSTCVVAK